VLEVKSWRTGCLVSLGRLAEGVFDIEDLKFRTYELADFVQQVSKVYLEMMDNCTAKKSNSSNYVSVCERHHRELG
jgi:hypothetical protein